MLELILAAIALCHIIPISEWNDGYLYDECDEIRYVYVINREEKKCLEHICLIYLDRFGQEKCKDVLRPHINITIPHPIITQNDSITTFIFIDTTERSLYYQGMYVGSQTEVVHRYITCKSNKVTNVFCDITPYDIYEHGEFKRIYPQARFQVDGGLTGLPPLEVGVPPPVIDYEG